ncbi:hypothetical protein HPB47_015917 [Ixodes persulcatus]|uniref:Uncharacterized protein n=1 Tax=Ixodes persulcatus TaxID=34615 RepID=A0AC60QSB0_IXOPE|nr:hypothetical protein HPB47_015917 [Ixodes persulcatus]
MQSISPQSLHLDEDEEVEGDWAAKFEELKGELKEEREKRAVLETQVKKLNDELRQEREKRAELESLGVGFERIERDWAVKPEELKDMRSELNEGRKKREVEEKAWQGQLEEGEVTKSSNKDKHGAMESPIPHFSRDGIHYGELTGMRMVQRMGCR